MDDAPSGWRPHFAVAATQLRTHEPAAGIRLELAWQRWDALSITWNTVDPATAPTLHGRLCKWRPAHPEPLAAVTGRTLTGPATVRTPSFGGTGLHVHNGLDTTALCAEPAQPGYETAHPFKTLDALSYRDVRGGPDRCSRRLALRGGPAPPQPTGDPETFRAQGEPCLTSDPSQL